MFRAMKIRFLKFSKFRKPKTLRLMSLMRLFVASNLALECKRVITRYLSFMEILLYTIRKVKLLEDILMPQPIVPVEIPQSRPFDSKKRNDILLKVRNYRQEEDWARMGLPITRKEISNWHIKMSQYYLESLYNLLREKLLEQALLHADETSYRVLESDSHLTYYWTFLSGKAEKQGIRLYHHDQRRSGSVVQDFLGDYSGYVHCDMLRQ